MKATSAHKLSTLRVAAMASFEPIQSAACEQLASISTVPLIRTIKKLSWGCRWSRLLGGKAMLDIPTLAPLRQEGTSHAVDLQVWMRRWRCPAVQILVGGPAGGDVRGMKAQEACASTEGCRSDIENSSSEMEAVNLS